MNEKNTVRWWSGGAKPTTAISHSQDFYLEYKDFMANDRKSGEKNMIKSKRWFIKMTQLKLMARMCTLNKVFRNFLRFDPTS